MATLSAVVFKHQKKSDGTFPVKIRITQFSKSVYISTGIHAGGKYVDRKYKLKPAFIEVEVAPLLSRLRSYIPKSMYDQYEVSRIKTHLLEKQAREGAVADSPIQCLLWGFWRLQWSSRNIRKEAS